MDYTHSERLIITGMKEMIEKDGKTPQEVIERINDIYTKVFFALCKLEKGNK